ncbi:MAG TPA: hypothetical protein VFN31_00725 [Candidatus Saccharimonadales bacterium]|nr:hypothetical protein [Candidatus Saccharimonadales bacterium]
MLGKEFIRQFKYLKLLVAVRGIVGGTIYYADGATVTITGYTSSTRE